MKRLISLLVLFGILYGGAEKIVKGEITERIDSENKTLFTMEKEGKGYYWGTPWTEQTGEYGDEDFDYIDIGDSVEVDFGKNPRIVSTIFIKEEEKDWTKVKEIEYNLPKKYKRFYNESDDVGDVKKVK